MKNKYALIKALQAQEIVLKERERAGYDVPLTQIHKKYEKELCMEIETLRRYMRANVRGDLRKLGINWQDYV